MGSIIAVFERFFRTVLLIELIFYFGLMVLSSLSIVKKEKNPAFLIGIPLAMFTMHFAWGLGFLKSVICRIFDKN
jgi:hypothetical protein